MLLRELLNESQQLTEIAGLLRIMQSVAARKAAGMLDVDKPIDIKKLTSLPNNIDGMNDRERREFLKIRELALTALYSTKDKARKSAIKQLEGMGIRLEPFQVSAGRFNAKNLQALQTLASYVGKGYMVRWIEPPKVTGLSKRRPKGLPRWVFSGDPKHEKSPNPFDLRTGINPTSQKGHVRGAGLYSFDLDSIWPMIGHEFVPGTGDTLPGLRNVPMGLHNMGKIAVFKSKTKRILDLETLSIDDEMEMIERAERWLVRKGYNLPKSAETIKASYKEDYDAFWPGERLSDYISRLYGQIISDSKPGQPKPTALLRTQLYKAATKYDAISYLYNDTFKIVFHFNPNLAKHVDTINLNHIPDINHAYVPGMRP